MSMTIDRLALASPLPRQALDQAPRRIEGRDKVMGRVRYAGDITPNTLDASVIDTAVAIIASQASGRVLAIDGAAALACPGVRLLMTSANAPRLKKVMATNGAEIGDLLPLQDDTIHYGGQVIGLLVADTLETPATPPPW